MRAFPEDIEKFGITFINAQTRRHSADYDPSYRVARSEVLAEIGAAEAAIAKLKATKMKDRRALAAWVTLGNRE